MKAYYTVSFSITKEEKEELNQLKKDGIKMIHILRAGIKQFQKRENGK